MDGDGLTNGGLEEVVLHELRNGISAVAMAMQMLSDRLGDMHTERTLLDAIRARLAGLDSLVRHLDLLMTSSTLRPQSIHVRSLIDGAVGCFSDRTHFDDLEVRFTGDDALVRADTELVTELVHTVLLNAAQAMEGKGTVEIHASRHNGCCWIEVTDHGPGIPGDIHDRVTEPPVRHDADRSGMGLAVARSLAKIQGGDLTLGEADGHGGSVIIQLPLHADPSA